MADGGLGVVGITKNGYYVEAISAVFPFYSPPGVIVFPDPSPPVSFPVLTLFEKLSKPVSTGSLHLESPMDIRIAPKVRFNYFSDPKDLATCVQGMHNVEKAMNSQAMEKYKFQDQEGNRYFKFVGLAFPENKT
ncbi:(R)-mandelonitrile lyase [Bertholletia excelsa]